jgi:hypothetical protein
MLGVLVTSVPEHLDRLDKETIQQIYAEVSIDARQLEQLMERCS